MDSISTCAEVMQIVPPTRATINFPQDQHNKNFNKNPLPREKPFTKYLSWSHLSQMDTGYIWSHM